MIGNSQVNCVRYMLLGSKGCGVVLPPIWPVYIKPLPCFPVDVEANATTDLNCLPLSTRQTQCQIYLNDLPSVLSEAW